MSEEIRDTDRFRLARFVHADVSGAIFRDCDVQGVKIVDCWIGDASISGDITRLVVNDVDVTSFVESELDRRHPERVQRRAMQTATDYAAMWDTIERLWTATTERARRLPEEARQQRVDGEWSFVETMRHLTFATDAWVGSCVLDRPQPYHPLGYPADGYPAEDADAIGLELDARPSFDEVLAARLDRMAIVRDVVDGLTDAELERRCSRSPAPGYPDEPYLVGRYLRVVMNEEVEHHRYAARDLGVLESEADRLPAR